MPHQKLESVMSKNDREKGEAILKERRLREGH